MVLEDPPRLGRRHAPAETVEEPGPELPLQLGDVLGERRLAEMQGGLQGVGTAMVYPTLLTAITDHHPAWRASSLGVYRFWRDLGYAVGALISGVVADLFGFAAAIHLVAGLTLLSGLVVAWAMEQPAAQAAVVRA